MACLSEGEDVVAGFSRQHTECDDAGIAARLAKRLIGWNSANADKLQVIRPGGFTANYIRSSGLKEPVLVKGDRFNENPQMGLMWPDVHSISVDVLADYIGGERKVDTWDVVKQKPGPAWTLSQWCTYWHARQDAATRMAKPQTAHGGGPPPGRAGIGGYEDEDDDEGEVVDSCRVLVLQGAGARTNVYQPPRACQGISPEQAQRLLDGECLPLHGSSLTQHIHPPPAVQSVDLVRPVLRDANAVFGSAAAHPASASAAAGLGGAGAGVAAAGGMGEGSAGEAAAAAAAAAALGEGFGGAAGRHLIHLEIKPADTLHLQMTPKDCYTDFRTAPGGAASWLYVLHGSKVLLLLPPTQRNRRLFLTWRGVTRAAQGQENLLAECFLADYAEGAVKVEVKASQALVIPCGWFYASATPSDSLAVGCFFWHPYALGDAARAQQMELALKIRPPRFAGPARQLLWYAGVHYAKQLRERLGLAAFAKRRPAGSVDAARASRSEASLNQQQLREQQQRLSPYLRGSSAGAGVGAALQRGAAGQRGTPPLLGLTQQQQQQQQQLEGSSGGVLGSPMSSAAAAAAARGKRGRQEMDALCLGEAAVPVGPAAAAAAAGGGGAAAGGLKRLRANTGKPVTPHRAGLPGSQQQQQQQQQGNLPSHSGGTTPRSTNRSAAAAAAFGPGGGGQQQQRRQQQQQWRSPQRQLPGGRHNVVNDDDDEGECHTSPDVGSEQQQQRRKSPDSSSAGSHAVSAAAAAAPTALPQLQQQQQQQPLQQQQQPAPMLPPPPTKLSAWELAELPILLEYLSEQVAEKSAELPLGMTDPEWLLQQMEESVAAARAKEDGDAAGRAALNTNINTAVAAREVQQVQEQQQLTPAEAAAAAARWSEGCGPLMLQPLAPDEMPAGFGEQWRAAQALLRSSGLVGFGAGAGVDAAGQPHEATTEVVGETDPDAGSVGTASWDNRSAGSIGGSRGAAAAAAAGGGGRGRGGSAAAAGDAAAAGIGSGGHVRGQVKRGPSGSVPAGVMQAKSLKRQQVMKGIGMKR
ncbi:hypothetical protein OEZ85_000351 [Tetradesmus obliquus]|uniref:JmjC domain-containing protein n=1 Tax=Tetradesmus obliquus TaxID=3088 RepID=A0ABY8UQ03_TETOB|nr:hypothetical protein OEZ85_000351 [Tetradesmus obliquus]